jgi:hypothetical protein
MRKIIIATAWAVAVVAAASALEVGVGASYAPALMAGGASTGDRPTFVGVKARASLGDPEAVSWVIGAGYSDYACRGEPLFIPHVVGYGVVESIPTAVLTFGASYGITTKPWIFNVEGGVAAAAEFVPTYYGSSYFDTLVEFAPGVYAGGGASRALGGNWAFAFGPRVTFLFDDPVESYQIYGIPLKADYRRAGRSSVLLDVMFGLDYHL